MTKADLVEGLSSKLGVTKSEAERTVDSLIEAIIDALKQGDRVNISGFGAFAVLKRAARTGRSPKNGEPIEIAVSRVAKFKPGKQLRDSLNGASSEGNRASTLAQ
jgi:DNA-binding protein HU-beta